MAQDQSEASERPGYGLWDLRNSEVLAWVSQGQNTLGSLAWWHTLLSTGDGALGMRSQASLDCTASPRLKNKQKSKAPPTDQSQQPRGFHISAATLWPFTGKYAGLYLIVEPCCGQWGVPFARKSSTLG